jgi:hypothetical protein
VAHVVTRTTFTIPVERVEVCGACEHGAVEVNDQRTGTRRHADDASESV